MGGQCSRLRLWELQGHLAALEVIDGGKKTSVASVGEERLELKAVDRLAFAGYGHYRKLHDRVADGGCFRRGQSNHIQYKGSAVVRAAGLKRGLDQCASGIAGSRTFA